VSKLTNIEGIYPLVPLQNGLLFSSLYSPGSGVYSQQLKMTILGPLDPARLKNAWERIIERHSALRTSFLWQGQEHPVQVVRKSVKLPFQVIDWRSHSVEVQDRQLGELLDADRNKGFDLTQSPLLRITLIRKADEVHEMIGTSHHIVVDGWSNAIIMRELLFLLQDESPRPGLPGVPASYESYIRWMRAQNPALAEAFWRRSLRGIAEPTPVPEMSPGNFHGAGALQRSCEFHSDVQLKDRLQRFASACGVTLSTVLAGAWALMLQCCHDRKDVVFGLTVAGRPAVLPGVDEIVGLFINTLPLRAPAHADTVVSAWLQELQSRIMELQEHAYSDLIDVQKWSEMAPGRPLFESIFVFENYPARLPIDGSGKLAFKNVHSLDRGSFPLALLASADDALHFGVTYDSGRFTDPSARRLMERYFAVLEMLGYSPSRQLWEISALTAGEHARLVVENNQTNRDFGTPLCLHQLFEIRADMSPRTFAIGFDRHRWTYAELNARANRLGHYLRLCGVRPEDRVGIHLQSAAETVVAILAVLKAGGAYVPLDAAYPLQLLQRMVVDASMKVIVTEEKLIANLPREGARLVDIAHEESEIEAQSESNLHCITAPDNLAYVIYTSGSTGLPKGVAVSHRNAFYAIQWVMNAFSLNSTSKILLSVSTSFDPSVAQIFSTLASGAELICLRPGAQDVMQMLEIIEEQKATLLDLPPSVLAVLVDEARPEQVASVSHVLCGGEALPPTLPAHVFAKLQVPLSNLYGPTETSINASCWTKTPDCAVPRNSSAAQVSIGRPIANVQIYILDSWWQPVPSGVAGEIYIGGHGVSRGYLGLPELTAEKFIPDRFSQVLGSRLYRTGDLARFFEDGNIEFLGRVDSQVKIRGLRIELGQVEVAMQQHAAVREAAAMVRENRNREPLLVGYVSVRQMLPEREFKEFLKTKLPAYMVPSILVFLEEFPRLPNGKMDRSALPPAEVEVAEASRASRNQLEGLLTTIWASMLRRDVVGIDENFFVLGGHSLTAIRISSKIQEVLGIEVPVRLLFEKPTVAELSEAIQWMGEVNSPLPIAALPVRVDSSRAPMSFAQRRLWFLDKLAPGEPFYNVPEAFRLFGPLDEPALEAALAEIIKRHAVLRTTFSEEGGELLQLISDDLTFKLPVIDLTSINMGLRESEARRLVDEEARAAFDLEQGPLLRVHLLRLDAEDHLFLLTFHHIIVDGWSVDIIRQEIATLYRSFREHQASPLPALPLQYADFAFWQQQLTGEKLDEKLRYWKRVLAGTSGILELPTDMPRPAVQTFRGASGTFEIPIETVRMLKRLSLRESATSFMILLAVFKTLLYRYSGQADILVGSPVSGRSRSDVERSVGLFLNTIVLRTDLSGNPSFRELLKRVRAATLGAYSNHDVPFERIIEEVNPLRDLSRSPLFQVMFSFQQLEAEPAGDFGGLHAASFAIDPRTAKFDLELLMTESGDKLTGVLEYNTDLFLPPTINGMISHFHNILDRVAADPECAIDHLPLLGAKERREILEKFVAGPQRPLTGRYPHEILESHAEQIPARLAVHAEDGSLTYAELNETANAIAHRLMEQGLASEAIVAVLSDRGSVLLASMFGIWKAGCAYLPLDPKYPAKRLAEMLEQSRAEIVIVTPDWVGLLQAAVMEIGSRLRIATLQSEALLRHPLRHNPVSRSMPRSLAYVIFTSGSTGVPKGAMVEHQGMLNHLFAKIEDLRLTSNDAIAQTASQCFDISIWQFVSAVVVGGRTHVMPDATAHNASRLLEDIEENKVSVLEVVPALLRLIMEELDRSPGQFPLRSLRWLIATGEALPPALARKWLTLYPRIPIVNAYGPTECSDDVTHAHICDPPAESANSIPIGIPVRNMFLYILDANMQIVPVGVPGEIYVGGVGVGRGYIHNPEATARAFRPNPFSSKTDEVLYRTGDRARFLLDGSLDFLGRVDHQVKVRGFRIELGETEFRLRQHPGVRDCVVVDTRDADGATQLVGYVVLDGRNASSPDQLRKFLKLSIPEYMVPSLILVLDALPLTPSGKIDRKALPTPDLNLISRVPFAAPATEIERRLVRIWEKVLRATAIGINDNFFDLGGHSILALRMMVEIHNHFGHKLPLTALFQHGTIKELAATLESSFSQSSSPLIAMQPAGSKPALFFIHVGSGEVMCYVDLVRHLGKDQPFYGLQDPNLYAATIAEMSIEKRSALYIEAMRLVQPHGPYFLGGWSFGGLVAFEMARQLCGAGETVGLLALLDTGSPDFVRQMDDPNDDAALLGIIAREMNVRITDAELYPLNLDDKFALIATRMRSAGLNWEDAVGFLARQLTIFKSRNRMILEYCPSPYDGPITFFRASQEYTQDANPSSEIARDPARGFTMLTTGTLDLHIIPGNHHEIAREPGVRALATALAAAVDKALLEFDWHTHEAQSRKAGMSA